LECLAGFPKLEALHLGFVGGITNRGLKHLKDLHSLKGIRFYDPTWNDTLLGYMKKWPQLVELTLPEQSGPEGLSHLSVLANLRRLDFDLGKKAETGLYHLERLPMLRKLNLGGELTDKGLLLLKNMTDLKKLSIDFRAKVSKKGIAKLQKLLPDLDIYKP